ncbi:MAG: hypothetical protein FRX49_08113 [Trebouxia sp. A1-2]|nr:MAG: hypothetical protein FRX49_08113 [Trebouxia sp. A1-2]
MRGNKLKTRRMPTLRRAAKPGSLGGGTSNSRVAGRGGARREAEAMVVRSAVRSRPVRAPSSSSACRTLLGLASSRLRTSGQWGRWLCSNCSSHFIYGQHHQLSLDLIRDNAIALQDQSGRSDRTALADCGVCNTRITLGGVQQQGTHRSGLPGDREGPGGSPPAEQCALADAVLYYEGWKAGLAAVHSSQRQVHT